MPCERVGVRITENAKTLRQIRLRWLVVALPSESTGLAHPCYCPKRTSDSTDPRIGTAFLHLGLEAALRCSVCWTRIYDIRLTRSLGPCVQLHGSQVPDLVLDTLVLSVPGTCFLDNQDHRRLVSMCEQLSAGKIWAVRSVSQT